MDLLPNEVPLFPGAPRPAFRLAAEHLAARRAHAPDLRGAVAAALRAATGGAPQSAASVAAGQAIADAVEAHGRSFTPGREPAYHDRYHQADATLAMGWLAGTARAMGVVAPWEATAGVLAMAGHDLLHDGSVGEAGGLEARSALAAADLAARAGVDGAGIAVMRRVILATDIARPPAAWADDDLLCRLGQEADVFASLAPELGWRLGLALARERRAAGAGGRVDNYRTRLAWLRGLRLTSPAAVAFGLPDIVADQIAAFAEVARRASGAPGAPELGAASLDARSPGAARACYRAALRAVSPA